MLSSLLFGALVFCAALLSHAEEKTAARGDFEVETLDGGTFRLKDQRGQWVIVNFWATWCSPCLREMPELSKLDAEHETIRVIGLAFEEIESTALREFLQKHPVSYPVSLVDVYRPPPFFDVPRGLPMSYLFDPRGNRVEAYLGPVTAKEILARIGKAP